MSSPDKRSRILKFLSDFIDDRGYAPTLAEIQDGCKISSKSVVEYHLRALERDNHIRRDAEVARGIEVSGMGKRTWAVAVLGTIAAGEPIPVPSADTSTAIPEEILEVPRYLATNPESLYALRVKGTSMIDALIDDGDVVLMKQASTAKNGEMVALWLKDRQEVTLKKIYREPGRIRLQPANSLMEPIYCRPDDVEIQGKVVGVLRKLSG
ncbi:transcriptional repressor LexA [Chloroflexota bacterium]